MNCNHILNHLPGCPGTLWLLVLFVCMTRINMSFTPTKADSYHVTAQRLYTRKYGGYLYQLIQVFVNWTEWDWWARWLSNATKTLSCLVLHVLYSLPVWSLLQCLQKHIPNIVCCTQVCRWHHRVWCFVDAPTSLSAYVARITQEVLKFVARGKTGRELVTVLHFWPTLCITYILLCGCKRYLRHQSTCFWHA